MTRTVKTVSNSQERNIVQENAFMSTSLKEFQKANKNGLGLLHINKKYTTTKCVVI